MPNVEKTENDTVLLRQIRDLLILQLRQERVSPEAIGQVLKVSGKTIQNRYPLRALVAADTDETEIVQSHGQTQTQDNAAASKESDGLS